MLDNIVIWLVQLIESAGYIGLFIAVFLETFFAPLPSGLIIPFAGFVASQSEMSLVITIFVAGLGSYFGSLPFYFLGVWGEEVVIKFLKKYGKYLFIDEDEVDKGFEIFNKYGDSMILFGRLVPIFRTAVSFPAGVAKVKFVKYTILTIIGNCMYAAILGIGGYYLGENWEYVSVIFDQYENLVWIVGILLVVAYISYKLLMKKILKSRK